MSDADRVDLSFVEEVTYGVTPATNLQRLRFTSEGLNMETDSVQSAEISNDRQIKGSIRTNIRGAGDINFEMSYDVIDAFLQAALFSTAWSSEVSLSSSIAVASGANTITRISGDWNSFSIGQWVATSGYTDPANNGVFKIEAISSLVMTLSGGALVTEANASRKTVQGAQLVNGTALNTYSIEREYTDIANEFELFRGMAVDQLAINVATNALINGVVSFVGKDAISGTATAGGGYNAAPTNVVMNTIDHIAKILEGDGSNAAASATAITMQIANNLRGRNLVGTLGAASIGQGKFAPTGTLQKYFATKTLMDKYLNQTQTALSVILQVGTTEAYVFEFPAIKFTSGQRVAGGENTDIIADLGWIAYKHATEAITMRVVKFADITP